MKGAYEVRVENARVQFKFRLERNLTVLRGDSATGKTTLVQMIADYEADGPASGVTLSSPKKCRVLEGRYWKYDLEDMRDCFVFIDEGGDFLHTEEFATSIKHTDNYYIIVSRDSLPMLPYSVEEVYELKNTTSRYPDVRKFYSQTKRMYTALPHVTNPETVIVEDSNAGYEFFKALSERSGAECVSAGGKSNIQYELGACKSERILVIADGAAFGPEMELVLALAKRKGAGLFLPECFEYVILSSGLIRDSHVKDAVANPWDHIDSSEFFSWENFFDKLLTEVTRGTYLEYHKSRLNQTYLQDRELAAISQQLEPTGLPRA